MHSQFLVSFLAEIDFNSGVPEYPQLRAAIMLVLVIGSLFVIVGAMLIRFPELCQSLRDHDAGQWQKLGSPSGLGFADLGKTAAVASWLLARGYEQSSSPLVVVAGEKFLAKARLGKFLLLSGAALLALGFILALFGL